MSSTSRGIKKLSFGVEKILSMETTPKNPERPKVCTYPWYSTLYSYPGNYETCDFAQGPTNFPCFPLYDARTVPSFTNHYRNGTCGNVIRPAPVRAVPKEAVTSPASSTTSQGENNNGGRRRSWSRAVFSALQRKGLEKRFLMQKYIAKPDRRALAATLGLTDAQVKVWFQNRRMKWRNTNQNEKASGSQASHIKETTSSTKNLEHLSEIKSSDDEDIDVGSDV